MDDHGLYNSSKHDYEAITKIAENIQWQRNHLILTLRSILGVEFSVMPPTSDWLECIIEDAVDYPIPQRYGKILAHQTYGSFLDYLPVGAMTRSVERRQKMKMLPVTKSRPTLIYLPQEVYGRSDGRITLPVPRSIQDEARSDEEIEVLKESECPIKLFGGCFIGALLVVTASGKIYTYFVIEREFKDRKDLFDSTSSPQRFLGSEVSKAIKPVNRDRVYKDYVDTEWAHGDMKELELDSKQAEYIDDLFESCNALRDQIIAKVEEVYENGKAYWSPTQHLAQCKQMSAAKRVPSAMVTGVASQVASQYTRYFWARRSGASAVHPLEIKEGLSSIGFTLKETRRKRFDAVVPIGEMYTIKYKGMNRIFVKIDGLEDESIPKYVTLSRVWLNGKVDYYSQVHYTRKPDEWLDDEAVIKQIRDDVKRKALGDEPSTLVS